MFERALHLISKYPSSAFFVFFVFIPLFFGLYYYRYLNKELKWMVGYLLMVAILNMVSFFFAIKKLNNMAIYNLKDIFEAIIFGITYLSLVNTSFKKITILTTLFLSVIFGIFQFSSVEFFAFPSTVFKIFLILLVFLHFNTILSELKVKKILYYPAFWISAGLIIYTTSTLLIFLFAKITLGENVPKVIFLNSWNVALTGNFVLTCMLMLAFRLSKLEKQNNE